MDRLLLLNVVITYKHSGQFGWKHCSMRRWREGARGLLHGSLSSGHEIWDIHYQWLKIKKIMYEPCFAPKPCLYWVFIWLTKWSQNWNKQFGLWPETPSWLNRNESNRKNPFCFSIYTCNGRSGGVSMSSTDVGGNSCQQFKIKWKYELIDSFGNEQFLFIYAKLKQNWNILVYFFRFYLGSSHLEMKTPCQNAI